jgi:hypothetical protein
MSLSQEIAQLENKRNFLNEQVSSMTQQISDLSKQRDNLISSVDTLSTVAKSNNNEQATTKDVIQRAANARYSVGIIGYGIVQKAFDQITNFFNEQGYTVIQADLFDQREKWMAQKPTVFYYSSDSRDKAREIANSLKTITGATFETSVGGGFGVPKGSERWSLRVNFVSG